MLAASLLGNNEQLPAEVKVSFVVKHSHQKPTIHKWWPHSQYLYEVIIDAGVCMGDFSIFYLDKSGDEVKLTYGKPGVASFLREFNGTGLQAGV